MKGIQYSKADGIIFGCVSPPVDVANHPEWTDDRDQLIVDGSVNYDGMKVDITQTPPVLIPA